MLPWPHTLLDALSHGLRLFCPTPCVGCPRPEGPLCGSCREEILERRLWSRREGEPWTPGPAPGAPLHSLGPYGGPLRGAILGAKREGNPRLAALVGELGAAALLREPGILDGAEALIHPPAAPGSLHPAEALARALGRRSGLPVLARLLHRMPGRTRARFLAGQERARHVERSLRAGLPPPPGLRRILLVDDVTTTGATLRHATALLRHQGLRVQGSLTLAFVPRSTPQGRAHDLLAGAA